VEKFYTCYEDNRYFGANLAVRERILGIPTDIYMSMVVDKLD
jgi:hypothetical protein